MSRIQQRFGVGGGGGLSGYGAIQLEIQQRFPSSAAAGEGDVGRWHPAEATEMRITRGGGG